MNDEDQSSFSFDRVISKLKNSTWHVKVEGLQEFSQFLSD
jgi:hypothetical protein